ncbi:MAG: winged helix-turn-helix transcriptional regulator [Rhodobiaceae bacterium]|nr:winged helix-turn-helix transcriptional regulator [Caldilineaceae bacterium]MCB1471514.1 winged helix-turn-helix transcriptional regulator [Rhodobiaceae bacterium]MCC0053881.1 winged helix-turn-helix transcriptional regulator [Rhodobiaceae bacterium]
MTGLQAQENATRRTLSAQDVDALFDNAARAADFLRTLSHETRLMILCSLIPGEKSVSEMEEFLALRQPTVSQQLARLRSEGLVATRRDGKSVYYRLASPHVEGVIGVLYDIFCDTGETA